MSEIDTWRERFLRQRDAHELAVRERDALRAELAATQRAKRENDERFQVRAAGAEATIKRALAVLDDIDETDRVRDLDRVLRAILAGDA